MEGEKDKEREGGRGRRQGGRETEEAERGRDRKEGRRGGRKSNV